MEFFEKYISNTYAGSGNQLYFNMDKREVRTGRIFYKIAVGGEYNYSILFSNILDSTYADGSVSHKNLICDEWTIHETKIGKCKDFNEKKDIKENTDVIVTDIVPVTFNGKKTKEVMPGEFFSTDPIKLNFEKDDFLCLEMTFSGRMIPYHEETQLPVYVKENEGWKYSKFMPFASMVGCDRAVKARVAYIGDSITQGIGVEPNSYLHWNVLLSEKIGADYSFWNLGIGYARANDAASDGAWLYKAKQNDIVFVCYGVNDIFQGMSEEQIKSDLAFIVEKLKNTGAKVVLQTVPPFGYTGEVKCMWERINMYIKTVLRDKVDIVFDVVPVLGKDTENPNIPKYGGHPNAEGCAAWAMELYENVKGMF